MQPAHQSNQFRQAFLPVEAWLAGELAQGFSRQWLIQDRSHPGLIQLEVLQYCQGWNSLFLQLYRIVDEALGVRAQQGR
ncbi:hypothetical protein D9M71_837910 [compost metagenome]